MLTIVAASVAVGTINDIDSTYRDDIINEDDDDRSAFDDAFALFDIDVPNTPGLVDHSRGICGWVIAICAAVTLYQLLVISLRLLNVGLINLWIAIFLAAVRQY